ncbi:MAG TPA: V-type ATP synthase subunit E [Nitrososphaerales archaeon]|nr:V-type ATP synthase subunit E [Nitrososphaerales archaeon]
MMGADALLREVEDKRKKALEALEAEYSAKREEVKKRTDEQLAYIMDSAKQEAAAASQREKIKIQGAAKLQAKKVMFDATEKMLENNIDALRQALSELASSPSYPDLLTRMARYASKRLGGKIAVTCRKADEATLKAAGAKIASTNLNSMGGFVADSEDGSLELDLTFEELLRSREDEVRASILGKE